MQKVSLVRAADMRPGPPTPGMVRHEAFQTDGVWAGSARTEPQMVSGWHHHGKYESIIYMLTGELLMESGPGGADVLRAGPGDFLHVPRHAVHRESNPATAPAEIIVVRSGTGPSIFNVDGPDAAA